MERSSSAPAYDPGIVADLEACFGRARLRDLLGLLRAEIAARFVASPAERETLERDAHVLVSASGMLGFLDLSRACAELGRACRDGVDLSPALDLAGQAARVARETIDGMLAEPA
ncbi:Hpt domain-containing protein [uncultured Methylobacterium sp.]|uniref:Hpt domain-containing protein n=1 Tax=uncultured Methylobacterium sp. TaxID=157278 RepID=UPI0035C9F665